MKVTRERKLRWFLPLVFFFSIIIDSALPAIFPAEFLADSQRIVSHLMLYWVITFAFYFREREVLLYSLLFGVVADSYNTTIIGIFAFGYWFIAYCVTRIKRYLPKRGLVHFMLFIVLISLLDFAIFVFYRETGYTQVTLSRFIMENLVPTLIFNTVLSFVLYFPTRSILTWLGYENYYIV